MDASLPLGGYSPVPPRPGTNWEKLGGRSGETPQRAPAAIPGPYHTARAPTRAQTSVPSSSRLTSSDGISSARGVPALDLTKTEGHINVTYNESPSGPPGMSVPMVRTGGGFGSFRS